MSDNRREPIAIGYLPWADLKDEFTIGPVSFWPFYEKADERITDSALRNELTQFFQTFVDNVGSPVKSVVICSIDEINVRRFTSQEFEAMIAAVDCLLFSAIATGVESGVRSDNTSMAPPSADRFDLAARWVWPMPNGLVLKTDNSTQFWSHGEYLITRPISLGGSYPGNYKPLLNGLSQVFESGFPSETRGRLFRALEWFRFAHTESTAVSWMHKVVMMATAFEILLDFPERDKRRYFIKEIDARFRLAESFLVELPDGQGGTLSVCKAAEWAGQFYKLRNDIVHGDEVNPERLRYKQWVTHLIVADRVMLEWVKRLLYEHECLGHKFREHLDRLAPLSPDSRAELERRLLPGIIGLDLDPVHEALDWIPPLEERIKRHE